MKKYVLYRYTNQGNIMYSMDDFKNQLTSVTFHNSQLPLDMFKHLRPMEDITSTLTLYESYPSYYEILINTNSKKDFKDKYRNVRMLALLKT